MSKEKEVKTYKAIDPADVGKSIDTIVSLMESVDASRELINAKVKYLKDTYGLNSTHVRAAATAIKKQAVDEIDEKTRAIQEIIDLCTS
jgi:isopropylmalate/homocitrate/citramalate synthase